jgi:hypothetical protein
MAENLQTYTGEYSNYMVCLEKLEFNIKPTLEIMTRPSADCSLFFL